jgi:phage/plasmid-like protein (TIGR03299 family)
MSHGITSEDGLVLNREPAWHGLGTTVQEAPTVHEAFRIAHLNWEVEKLPIYASHDKEGGTLERIPDRVGLRRSDTARILEVVGKGYEVFQNRELADLIENLSDLGEVTKVESAGSLRQGRNVFALIPRESFTLGERDTVRRYVLFSNTHDGTGALAIIPTSVRVVCANTLSGALSGFRVRHSAQLKERIELAIVALRASDEGGKQLETSIRKLASVPMDDEDRRVFFLRVYETAFGIIPAKPATETEIKAHEKARETVASWIANLESSRNTGTGTEGSVWHALNAMTEWSDHSRRVKSGTEGERGARTFSNLFGTSAVFKAKALEVALQVAQ